MLGAMRRPYDLDYYAGLVDRIRSRIPNASIGSDINVGFPAETEDDFGELVSYLETSPLTHLHVFPYSDRPGTVASRLGDRADGLAVKARGARVRQIGAMLTRRFVESQAGTVHRGLTLEDGSQWQSADPMPYGTPKIGHKILIKRAALSAYKASVNGWAPVKLKRVG